MYLFDSIAKIFISHFRAELLAGNRQYGYGLRIRLSSLDLILIDHHVECPSMYVMQVAAATIDTDTID